MENLQQLITYLEGKYRCRVTYNEPVLYITFDNVFYEIYRVSVDLHRYEIRKGFSFKQIESVMLHYLNNEFKRLLIK